MNSKNQNYEIMSLWSNKELACYDIRAKQTLNNVLQVAPNLILIANHWEKMLGTCFLMIFECFLIDEGTFA